MLTPEQWDGVAKQAEKIYSELELEIIKEVAERIARVGYANTVVLNDVMIAQEMGLLYQDIVNMVAEYNNASVDEIKNIFQNAGISSITFDDEVYKEAGLRPIPIKQSKSMLQMVTSMAIKTHNNLSNLTMTTASTTQNQFYKAMNKAYMEVSTGVKSYSQAIVDSIKEISDQGAYITYPSGQRRSLESAVRMNVVTSVNQTCGKLQEMRADEMGWDLMEITAHSGARPEHAEWQGKIVSRSGKNKKYLTLADIGYGEATGFKGVNCRHDWLPYYEGSTRTYTYEELTKLQNETLEYNGKTISKYEATQIQRSMERQIRQSKKEIAGLEGILTSDSKDSKLIETTKVQLINAQNKLRQNNSVLNGFVKDTGLRKDSTRLYIGGINSINNKLNRNEIYAINTYVSSESFTLNESLRHGIKLTKRQQTIKTNLDSALNKCTDYKGNVVRVLQIEDDEKLLKFLKKNEIGKTSKYNEYLSFSNKQGYNPNANVYIYTNSKRGKDITKFNLSESEILYKRDSIFFVENVVEKDGKYYILWRDMNE